MDSFEPTIHSSRPWMVCDNSGDLIQIYFPFLSGLSDFPFDRSRAVNHSTNLKKNKIPRWSPGAGHLPNRFILCLSGSHQEIFPITYQSLQSLIFYKRIPIATPRVKRSARPLNWNPSPIIFPRRLTMTLETFEPKNGGSWRFIHKDRDGNLYSFHEMGPQFHPL